MSGGELLSVLFEKIIFLVLAELNLTFKLRYFAGCQERSVELAQSFTFVFCYSNFSIFVFTIHSFMFVLYFPFPELLLLEEGRIGKEREK